METDLREYALFPFFAHFDPAPFSRLRARAVRNGPFTDNYRTFKSINVEGAILVP